MLNYSDFIKESLVLENRKTAKERYKKGFGKFDSQQFELLMTALPLDKKGEPKTLYADYIVNWFIQDNMIDLDEVKSLLISYNEYLYRTEGSAIFKLKEVKTFDIFKEKTTDIIKTINDKTGSNDKILYEDNDWVVYKIENHDQSKRLGKYTPWCITMDDEKFYKRYTKEGLFFFVFVLSKKLEEGAKSIIKNDKVLKGSISKDMLNFSQNDKGNQYENKLELNKKNLANAFLIENNTLRCKSITNWSNEEHTYFRDDTMDNYSKFKDIIIKIYSELKGKTETEKTIQKRTRFYFDDILNDFPNKDYWLFKDNDFEFDRYGSLETTYILNKENNTYDNIYDIMSYGAYVVDNDSPVDFLIDDDMVLVNATIKNGVWKKGGLLSCTLKNVIIEDCVSISSKFKDCNWKNGIMKSGNINRCIWENGTVIKGDFYECDWKNGKIESNNKNDVVFDESNWVDGTCENATFFECEISGGYIKNSNIHESVWYNGTSEDNSFSISNIWENGDWISGKWFITQPSEKENKSSVWKKGNWKTGKLISRKYNINGIYDFPPTEENILKLKNNEE